jgi:hypothetical protein
MLRRVCRATQMSLSVFQFIRSQTGGSFLEARRNANIASLFTRISQELRSHYLLGVVPAAGDGQVRKLAVLAKHAGITVRSRRSDIAERSGSQ